MVYELDDNLLAPQPWLGFYNRHPGRPGPDRAVRPAGRPGDRHHADPGRRVRPLQLGGPRRPQRRHAGVVSAPETATDRARSRSSTTASARATATTPSARTRWTSRPRANGGRRIWLGSDEPAIRQIVDEAHPYVAEVRGFARQLVAARPAIGLAPVGQDDFSRGHSELHWLEYSLAGAATVASRTMGGGPYDVIRDGVDGLLARNKAQWREQLRQARRLAGRCARSWPAGPANGSWPSTTSASGWPSGPTLSAGPPTTPAGARSRAAIRVFGAKDRPSETRAVEAEARASLAHRRMARDASRRGAAPPSSGCAATATSAGPRKRPHNPLVTVGSPPTTAGRLVVERSIGRPWLRRTTTSTSSSSATVPPPETLAAIGSVDDPRVRFVNLAEAGLSGRSRAALAGGRLGRR